MIGFPLGLIYANAGEWVAHKYLLHKIGKKSEDGFWAFHWYEHHRESRTHNMHDSHYKRKLFDGIHAQNKEAGALLAAALLHVPLFPIAPWFTAGVWVSFANYYRVHKKSHQQPEWARKKLAWHYDHHMGRNQDANWCVSWPWFDWVMGTREHYVGTEAEKRDIERANQIEKRRQVESQPSENVHTNNTPDSLTPQAI